MCVCVPVYMYVHMPFSVNLGYLDAQLPLSFDNAQDSCHHLLHVCSCGPAPSTLPQGVPCTYTVDAEGVYQYCLHYYCLAVSASCMARLSSTGKEYTYSLLSSVATNGLQCMPLLCIIHGSVEG